MEQKILSAVEEQWLKLLILLALSATFIWKKIWPTHPTIPPNLKTVPVVSGALPFVGHGIAFSKDIVGFISNCYEKYGKIFRIKIFRVDMVVICDRNLNNEFFKATEDKMSLYDVLTRLYFADAFSDEPTSLPRIINVVKKSIAVRYDTFAPKIEHEARKMIRRLRTEVSSGYPTEIFAHGIQIFFMNLILSLICIPASVAIFVVVLHKLKLTSVYEYLERRYNSKLVRNMASFIFILETTIITGVALYVPAIPLQKFLGWSTINSIIVIGFCGTLYTSLGGLKAVIFTDCFQFILIVSGLLAIVWRGFYLAGGFSNAFDIAYRNGRLNFFDFNINLFQNYNTFNILLGYGLSLTWFYGAHQPNFQRYSSLPTLKAATKGMLYNVLFQEVAFILIILSGIAIVSVYVECDPILTKKIARGDEIVPLFVREQLSFIPGMMGLFVSCILSAVLSTVSSSLNSLAAVTWEDFISKIDWVGNISQKSKELTLMGISFLYGLVTMVVAYLASTTDSIFQTSIIVMGSTSGTIGGAFIMALFIPASNYIGVSIGMVVGLSTVTFLSAKNLMLNLARIPLPTSLTGCDYQTEIINRTQSVSDEMISLTSYPEKFYTISIVLYPVIAATITCVTGTLISIMAGYFTADKAQLNGPKDLDMYMHPMVVKVREFIRKKSVPANNGCHQGENIHGKDCQIPLNEL